MSKAGLIVGFLSYVSFLALTGHSHSVPVLPQQGLKEQDRIGALPGQPSKANFEQYAGFIIINETAGHSLFYYFVEAEGPKDTLPLVLWLNGGPGCSSISGGAFQELGPFRVASDGKTLYTNEYAWNKAANILFLDQPVTTGYSSTKVIQPYFGDQQAANDNYAFLVNWLERFPEYKNRDFFLAGESYAGHYVPQLAQLILEKNKLGSNVLINLKGIAIGNPLIDRETNERARYEYLYHHSLIPENIIEEVRKGCQFSIPGYRFVGPCMSATSKASRAHGKGISQYNIMEEDCNFTGLTTIPKDTSVLKKDPCMQKYVESYLGRKDVQLAFHVTNFTSTYEMCRSLFWDKDASVLPMLQNILNDGIPIWIYGGDLDTKVPIFGVMESLKTLNLSQEHPWHPWTINSTSVPAKVAGYTVVFKGGLTYATVRAAGHIVPRDQPEAALVLFKSFLTRSRLPPKPADGGPFEQIKTK